MRLPAFFSLLLINLMLSPLLAQERPNQPIREVELADPVSTPKVERLNAIGTLFPLSEVIIRPEVAGKIVGIHFKEGMKVEKDSVLIEFDARIQRADVDEMAAQAMIAQQTYERLEAAKAGSTAQKRDEAYAALVQAEAKLERAKTQLEKMSLTAPFTGMVGFKNFDLGDYVQVGTDLLMLSDNQQLKLEFNLPERVAHVVEVGQVVHFKVDNFPQKTFKATVYAISPQIEQEGRSIAVRAFYDNDDLSLIAGMFVRLTLHIPYGYDVLLVPEEAVFAQEGKHYVYVADATTNSQDDVYKARLQAVSIGERTQAQVEVIEGLKEGELIVSAGQLRIAEGDLIQGVTPPAPDDEG